MTNFDQILNKDADHLVGVFLIYNIFSAPAYDKTHEHTLKTTHTFYTFFLRICYILEKER